MPELPEVETIKSGLSELLPGMKVKSVSSDWSKSFPNAPADVDKFLIDAKITEVRRRAKVLIIDLSTGYSLVIHLKMTGQLVFIQNEKSQKTNPKKQINPKSQATNNYQNINDRNSRRLGFGARDLEFSEPTVRFGAGHPTDSLVGDLPDKSTRVIFDLGSAKLFFNDQRKFGWVKLVPTIEIDNIDFFKKLGPEPLAADFTAKDFRARIRKRPNSQIKPVLIDQTIIAGVGNIYADESLWGAKIHPETRVKDISDSKLNKLFSELKYVLELSIEKGGSTDKNYVNAEGKKGSYLEFAQVFRRQNLPCPRCGTKIVKIRVAGRGTHLCPKCQKA
jgi:formamidopyrimidine-DNA glycosylase